MLTEVGANFGGNSNIFLEPLEIGIHFKVDFETRQQHTANFGHLIGKNFQYPDGNFGVKIQWNFSFMVKLF